MTQAACQIRRAETADGPHLIDLIVGLAEYEKLEPPDEAACQRLLADAFGDSPKFEAWLAFMPGQTAPVGCAIVFHTYSTFLAKPSLYIEDIFVLPTHRKGGIGSALLKHVVTLARERDCGRVEWTALDWNVNAQRVYEDKLGARHMKEWYLYRMTQKEMNSYLDNVNISAP